jgi:hypothetical protein
MARMSLPVEFVRGEDRVGGETFVADVGGDILVLTSCSDEIGLELRSAYLGGDDTEEVLVGEAWAVGSRSTELASRRLVDVRRLLIYERRRALYDHLQRLQDLALQRGDQLSFDGVDAAADQLDRLAPTPDPGL